MCDMASLNSFLLPIHRVPKLVETCSKTVNIRSNAVTHISEISNLITR